jgi:hypothetical protein
LLAFRFQFVSFLAIAVVAEARHSILYPMMALCGIVLVAIPLAAARGKLHMPGYAAISVLALIVGWALGRLGARAATGSAAAVVLSALFFILIAISIGSVLALAFYRQRPSPESQTKDSTH